MKILITGDRGLAQGIADIVKQQGHDAVMVSRSTGHDINSVQTWAKDFSDVDICVNSAYSGFAQVAVLETFADMWRDDTERQIINIGSMVADYPRSQIELDHQYWSYRLHKQALQSAYAKIMQDRDCQIKLINFGPIDTDMMSGVDVPKMSVAQAANRVWSMIQDPAIKRQDLWR